MADDIKQVEYSIECFDFNDKDNGKDLNKIEKSLVPEHLEKGEDSGLEWRGKLYNQYGLSALVDDSAILPQCISAYSRNIAGFGIGLKYKEDFDEETAEMKAEWDKAEEIISLMSLDKPLKSVFEDIITDRETVGIAYLEIIRDSKGNVVQAEHINRPHTIEMTVCQNDYKEYTYYYKGEPKTFRRRFKKYRQVVGAKTVYFKEFGDLRTMDKTDGKYKNELPIELEANEILEFKVGDEPYGKVRWLGQTLSVDGAKRAEVLNNNYFRKGRHIPLLIALKGGRLTEESKRKLKSYINDIQGEKSQHGFLVLEAENTDIAPGFAEEKKPEIEIKDLSPILQNDELFQDYMDNGRRKVQSAFLLPDLYTAYTTDFNRATAQTAMEVTEKQVFQPERKSLAWVINNKLLNGYGFKYVEVEFKAPDITNPDDQAKILQVTAGAGGLTLNDARDLSLKTIGREAEPYPDEIGNLPLALAQTGTLPQEEAIEKAVKRDEDIVPIMREVRKLLKNLDKGFTSDYKNGIINKWSEEEHPREDNGKFANKGGFSRPTLKLSKQEYGKVTHSINNVYKARFNGRHTGSIYIGKYKYRFEIKEFNEYNIYSKKPIN